MSSDLTKFQGVTPAIVSPLTEKLDFDEQAMGRMIEQAISAGVSGIFTLGVAGDYAAFTSDTKRRIVDTVHRVLAGRLPLIVGVTGLSTAVVIENIEKTVCDKADYILSTPPDFIDLTQEMNVDFFETIAEKSSVPVIIPR